MNDWFESARKRLAAAVDGTPSDYELSPADVERLLELARLAAHESGERTNAPLVAYLVGLAHGRHPQQTLEELVRATTGGGPAA
jgi:uncharacterized protein DUF6457